MKIRYFFHLYIFKIPIFFTLVLFSIVYPFATVASSSQSLESLRPNSSIKIHEKLHEEFNEKDKVEFLVKFTEKADVEKVAEESMNQSNALNLSNQEAIFSQRSAVISELKSVSFKSQENVRNLLEREFENGNVDKYYSYYIVNAVAVQASIDVAEKIATFPEVEKILPNETRQLFESSQRQWNTMNEFTGNSDEIEWNVKQIDVPSVWDMGINGKGTVVASIDSGVQWDHPALKEKYRGYDDTSGEVNHDFNWYDAVDGKDQPYDDVGHGTHVTGTMVGSESDGTNHIGIAPGAKWISVKAFTESGGKDTDLLKAAEWIMAPTDSEGNERVDMAPDVVNNSWGGGKGLDEWYRDVVKAWRANNIFPEFAAGNVTLTNPGGPGSIAVPANYPESFATGATDVDDQIADFSLRGPSPYDDIKPNISAPGVNIRSSVPGNGYDYKDGTSMAAPAISGVVALLRQIDNNISVDDIEDILINTATSLTDDEYPDSPNNGYGYGLVNALDAATFIMDGLGSIEGVVGEEGEDHEEPTFDHNPPLEMYHDMDTTLRIDAQDNISILSVKLKYKVNEGNWKTKDASLISGNYLDGEYEVTVNGSELEAGIMTYKWIINDYGDNKVESKTYDIPIEKGKTLGYSEDFETEPAGWTSFGDGDDWEWGEPTSGPEKALSGKNVYATNLAGSYTKDADAMLVMPAIDLPDEDAYLQFDIWYDLEEIHDVGYVYVSTDQEKWKNKQTMFYDSDGWETREIDLSEYKGERIYIGFNLTSNTPNEITKPGMYIDNVQLSSKSLELKNGITDEETFYLEEKSFKNQEEQLHTSVLPLDANVSILDTSRSVGTDPADGTYSLTSLAEGSYTLQAEAYGYYPDKKIVDVEQNEISTQNFILEEIPKGDLTGVITDKETGETIDGAKILLQEDANISPVESNGDGEFQLTAYQGKYTLEVIAPGYHNREISVQLDNNEMKQDIELSRYYHHQEEEINYDDGSAEIPRTFYDIGNRAAVKMSLPEDQEYALVTDGVFQFYDESQPFPGPGSTEFSVEVWDASGKNGLPGKKIAGPVEGEAIRDLDEWTVVDLRDENIIVDDDFYMVYVQTKADRYAPALGSDSDGPYSDRNYENINGVWEKSNEIEGNYMIRARVSYEAEEPTIITPDEDLITNDKEITVEGTASPTTTVQLMNNDEEVDNVEIDDDGEFEFTMTLDEGVNNIQAISILDSELTRESNPVSITLDTTAPELTIDSPEDGDMTNQQAVTVEGTVQDEHLDYVEVNGQEADIDGDEYSKRILLDEGENDIEVTAVDLAGNETTETVTIDAKFTAPEITNLEPTEDHYVETGESVEVAFESEPGLRATFVVQMPLTNVNDQTALASNPVELPLMEMEDGKYVGYWTVPTNAYAEGARIEVKVEDKYGNEVRELVEGRLFISTKE